MKIKNLIKNKFLYLCILLIAIELTACLLTYYILNTKDQINIDNLEITYTDNIINRSRSSIDAIQYHLTRNSALFSIHGKYISKKDYQKYIDFETLPVKNRVESFWWIHKITHEERNFFENFCNDYIVTNCTITQINGTNIIIADPRPQYWPLIFIEPNFLNSELLIGLDLFYDNLTKSIINEKIKNPNLTGTFRININSQSKNSFSFGVLLNKVSFKNITNPNINELNGLVSVLVRVNDIFEATLQSIDVDINRTDIDLFVFDETNDSIVNIKNNNLSLLYKEPEKYNSIFFAEDLDSTYRRNNFSIADRKWTVILKFSDNFRKQNQNFTVIIIPIVLGIIIVAIDIILIITFKYFKEIKEKLLITQKQNDIADLMLSYVNHEVRNPLNVIKGNLIFCLEKMQQFFTNTQNENILIDKKEFDSLTSDLYTAAGNCETIEHIVTDILDIKKLEEKKLAIDNRVLKIKDLYNEITKTVTQKLNEKPGIEFIKLYDEKLEIWIDVDRLKQVLINFLFNAIKFTESGSITLQIKEENNRIIFSVTDTGRGIKDKNKNKIFKRFQQIKISDSTRYGGIGLGLYLCKMLADCMDGEVGFESEYKKGN